MLPYAGGSSLVYNAIKEKIKPEIEVIVIEYKGRGKRSGEPYYEDIGAAVDDVWNFMKNQIDDDYAIFGHSMGGLITYELLKKIEAENVKYPKHIFISSRRAPQFKCNENKNIYLSPDETFINIMVQNGGIEEAWKNESLIKYMVPIVRADYRIIEQYEKQPADTKILCNMTIIYSDTDKEVAPYEVLAWKDLGEKNIDIFKIEGGHFYFKKNSQVLANIINNTLLIKRF